MYECFGIDEETEQEASITRKRSKERGRDRRKFASLDEGTAKGE